MVQLSSVALRTVPVGEELLVVLVIPCVRLSTVLYHAQNSLENNGLLLCLAAEMPYYVEFVGRAVQENVVSGFRVVFQRHIEVRAVFFDGGKDERTVPAVVRERFEAVYRDSALGKSKRLVGDYLVGVNRAENSETRAGGAGSERVVEREHTRFKLAEADAVFRAGVVCGELVLLSLALSRNGDNCNGAVGLTDSALDGV